MKQMIPTYTFSAAGKTVTLGGFGTVRLDRLLLIVNVTRNVIYYNFADATLGATVATNVITLTNVSTAGHADADKLEIFYDTVSGDPDYLTAQPVSAASLPLPSGAATSALQGAGLPSALASDRLKVDASGVAVPITDNSGSLTVDAPVGTPVFTRLSDGAAALVGQKAMSASLPAVLASDQVSPINNGKTVTYVSVAQGAAGSTVLASADATKKHKVVSAVLILDAAGSVKFTDGVGDLTGAMPVDANGGFVLSNTINPYTETGAINRALNLVTVTGKAFGVVGILTEA